MATADTIYEILNRINAIYAELCEDKPLEDEIEAMREYEERKRMKEAEFVPLEKILGKIVCLEYLSRRKPKRK